jgi:class 3 adenylate cyclase/CheY-like chemotaxis protein
MSDHLDHETFLAARRHDLRTPINAIIGYSEMLIEDLEHTDDPRVELLRSINRAGHSLSASVDEILKPEHLGRSGDEAIDLAQLAERIRVEVRSDISSVIGYSELLLDEPETDAAFAADIARVRDAASRMTELVDQIVEPAGDSHDLTEGSDEHRLMVQQLVTTVRDLETRRRALADSPGYVLVVDDNESNRELLARRLQREGHVCAFAENGRESLALATRERFDVILLDILMPEMDGYQVLQALKSSEDLADIPVIMLSGLDQDESVVRCIELGADDFLPKPFDPVLLRARIGASLEKKRLRDREKEYLHELSIEREKSERLLLNILPAEIAEQLKRSETTIAEHFPAATVLFADLVGFTAASASIEARTLVDMLNGIFSAFDGLTAKHDVEKIKTIGDAYMAVGGLPTPRLDHAARIAGFALDMLDAIKVHGDGAPHAFDIRIGIHSGPVVAGVIGTTKFAYDLWGDTVNTASRMESTGVPGRIQVSAATRPLLEPVYVLERRGIVEAKGKGALETYFLVAHR